MMRRRRRRLIPLVVIAVLTLAIILFSPWGLLKGSLYSRGNTESTQEEDAREEQAQAGPVEKKSDTSPPSIAIVVDDVGLDETNLPQWLAIDAPLSFAVMPYCVISAGLSDQLYDAGFLIMMHIPTENTPPNTYSADGQLSCGMDSSTVSGTLDADLATVPNVSGINNHQGGQGCADLQLMTYECEWARSKGFYVVDSNSAVNSKVAQAAVSLGLGHKRNEVFIDHQNDPEYIRSAMRKLADLATKNGYAIGICHFHRPNTPAVVGEMVKVLKEEGIHFAFARDINN